MSLPFKKMRLIQEEEYERLRQKQVSSYNPELRAVAHLEDEMKDIMDSKNITPEDKLKLFDQLRIRSNELRNQAKPLVALGGVSSSIPTQADDAQQPPPGVLIKQEVKKEDVFEEIIGRVSAKRKENAIKLMEIINSNPDILSINDNQEIVIKGHSIPNTKFSDLFTSLFTERQAKSLSKLEGIPSFLKALNSLHVPTNLITNSSLSKELEEFNKKPKSKKPQAGKGLSGPGKIQRILRIYRI